MSHDCVLTELKNEDNDETSWLSSCNNKRYTWKEICLVDDTSELGFCPRCPACMRPASLQHIQLLMSLNEKFISPKHGVLFILQNTTGKVRDQLLQITTRHYLDPRLMIGWLQQIKCILHPIVTDEDRAAIYLAFQISSSHHNPIHLKE